MLQGGGPTERTAGQLSELPHREDQHGRALSDHNRSLDDHHRAPSDHQRSLRDHYRSTERSSKVTAWSSQRGYQSVIIIGCWAIVISSMVHGAITKRWVDRWSLKSLSSAHTAVIVESQSKHTVIEKFCHQCCCGLIDSDLLQLPRCSKTMVASQVPKTMSECAGDQLLYEDKTAKESILQT